MHTVSLKSMAKRELLRGRKPRALVAFRVSLPNATGLDDALPKLLFNCFFLNIAKETGKMAQFNLAECFKC